MACGRVQIQAWSCPWTRGVWYLIHMWWQNPLACVEGRSSWVGQGLMQSPGALVDKVTMWCHQTLHKLTPSMHSYSYALWMECHGLIRTMFCFPEPLIACNEIAIKTWWHASKNEAWRADSFYRWTAELPPHRPLSVRATSGVIVKTQDALYTAFCAIWLYFS